MSQGPDVGVDADVPLLPMLSFGRGSTRPVAGPSSDAMLDALVRACPLAIVVLDGAGVVHGWNPAAERLFGWTALEVRGQPLAIFPPERWEAARRLIAATIEGVPLHGRATHATRRDGADVEIAVWTAAVRSGEKDPLCLALLADVTDRAAAVAALHETEVRYRLLASAAFEGITLHERGLHVDVNDAFAAMMGYSREELLGTSVLQVAAPESRATILEHAESGSEEPYEAVGVRKDGSRVDLEIRGRTVRVGDRELRAAALRDITRRKRVEAALRAARDQLQAILQGVADGISAQDPSGQLVYANAAAARMAGFATPDEMLGAGSDELARRLAVLSEDGRPVPTEQLPGARALRGEEAPELRLRFRRRDTGEERFSVTRARPLRDEQGRVVLAISIYHDLTDEQRAADRLSFLAEASALLASSLDYEATLTRVLELVVPRLADWCVLDLAEEDGRVRRLPIAYADPRDAAAARRLDRLAPATIADSGAAPAVMRTGEPIFMPDGLPEGPGLRAVTRGRDHARLLQTGGIRSSIIVPLTASSGVLGALTLVVTDRSGRRYTADDLKLALDLGRRTAQAVENARLYREAKEAIHTRDAFLSVAAHELKTPLASLQIRADLAQRRLARAGSLDEAALNEVLATIGEQTRKTGRMVNLLLDISRIEGGRLRLECAPCDLAAVIRDALSVATARSSEHAVRLSGPDTLPIVADGLRLEQVIGNLLENALKFSPGGGGIDVCLEDRGSAAVLTVRDHGLGIPPEERERVFDRFYQAHAAEYRSGMGLGLFVSRQIVELHGGTLVAETPEDGLGGTRFVLTLPFGGPVERAAPLSEQPRSS